MWSLLKRVVLWCCFFDSLLSSTVGTSGANRCLICNSTQTGCDEGLRKLVGNCTGGIVDSCFSRIADGVVDRGCLSQLLSSEERQQCSQGADSSCIACTENECNRHTWVKCAQCDDSGQLHDSCSDKQQARFCPQYLPDDSSYGNSQVVKEPSMSTTMKASFCPHFTTDDRCFSRILDQELERGCTSKLTLPDKVCEDNKNCLVCSEDGCNVESENSLLEVQMCLRCRSDTDDTMDCEKATNDQAKECDNLIDECYTRVQDGVMERDCLSTLSEQDRNKCQNEEDASCVSCVGRGCNVEQWLRCYRCSKLDKPSCAAPEDTELFAEFCDGFHYIEEKCYAKIVGDDVNRGCVTDLGIDIDPCEDSSMCAICTGDGCNYADESTLRRYKDCVSCSTDYEGEACEHTDHTTTVVTCDVECYTRVADGHLERGCLSSTDELVQAKCSDSSDQSCIVCDQSGCNSNLWRKCHQCQSSTSQTCAEEQEDAESTFCKAYNSQDKCYTKIINDQVERGCQSDAGSEVDLCTNAEVCDLCEEDSCNKAAGASLAHIKCQQCSSADSPDCALDGILTRNCLSTLDESVQAKCSDSSDQSCIVCDQSGCNSNLWRKCHQCQSSTSQTCAEEQEDAESTFCKAYNSQDKCYTKIINDQVERGCQSDAGSEVDLCTNAEVCDLCEEDSCNKAAGASLAHIKCQQCSSADSPDCALGNVESESCPLHSDRCYIAVDNDGILTRNCLSTLDESVQAKCSDSSDQSCIVCDQSGCNSNLWRKCHQCQSSTSQTCAEEQEDAESTFCKAYNSQEKCYTKIVNDQVERGCQSDAGSEVDLCTNAEVCDLCEEDSCNKAAGASLAHIKCQQCSSADSPDCALGNVESESCPLHSDRCYIAVDNDGILTRNCLSTLDESVQAKCSDSSDQSCIVCDQSGCNSNLWRKCHQCQSSTSQTCAEEQEDAESTFCKAYNSQEKCYTKIVNDQVERGCQSDAGSEVDLCTNAEVCDLCEEDSCNKAAGASLAHIKCQQCSSADSPDCALGNVESESCPLHSDRCYIAVDNDGILTRNCLSTLDESVQAKCSDSSDQSCIVCEQSGCNSNLWRKCHQCQSSTSQTCAEEQEDAESTFCKAYNSQDKCYTKIINDQVERGCQTDAGSEVDICTDAEVCDLCEEDSCNKAAGASLVHIKCQQCSSADSPDCALGNAESKSCPLQNDRCYTAVDNANNLIRGCFSNLNDDLLEPCQNETNQSCITCEETGCNMMVWPMCYRCHSSTESWCNGGLTIDKLRFCASYSKTNFCYASIVNDVLTRDCTTDRNAICNNNNACVACNSTGCNSISREELEHPHTCFQCSSNEGSCDVLEEKGQKCKHHSDRCYMKLSEGKLTRGCLSDIVSEECDVNNNCLVCDGKDCNNLAWPKCYQCSNATSVECSSTQQNSDRLQYCVDYQDTGCFTMVAEQSFVRGCIASISGNQCTDPEMCFKCTGQACNHHSYRSLFSPANCQQCHSDSGPSCVNGTTVSKLCKDPDDVCFYRKTPDQKGIHRGCLTDLSLAEQDNCRSPFSRSCHTCDQQGCNSAKWVACYQCSSLTNADCAMAQNDATNLKFCEKLDDHCFEDRTEQEIRRGCGLLYCDQKKTCVECNEDGCNGNSGSTLMPPHCLVCESSDPQCANGSLFDQDCEYLNEPCYSRITRNDSTLDGKLHRGCFSHLVEPHRSQCLEDTDQSCVTCTGNSCNRNPWRLCIQCSSEKVGNNCSRDASPLKASYCQRYKQDDRCFAKEVDGKVLRGCESDDNTMENVCEGLDTKHCFLCEKDHCNDKSLNAALRLPQYSFTLYIFMVTTIHILRSF
ncbi:uncharacterized protein LOC131285533 [Anopheles ziemanni]|uniref:uncharacterized protein LOC131267013 n=1 Tax=Anopheles coustani TaxID=139045 RepID=UPI002658A6EB|nr:uncharacterized protein LOC131267013 [Anopheles coustani]XP_058170374.1 uncharacterized protein LOC131285533 [Anopheles ziemanni]